MELYRGGVPRSPEGGRQAPLPRLWAGPIGRPRGGDRPPVARWGAIGPLFFFRDFVANLKKKNYTLGLSLYRRATGVYF